MSRTTVVARQFGHGALWCTLVSLVCLIIAHNCLETIVLTPKDFSKIKIKFDFGNQDNTPKFASLFDTSNIFKGENLHKQLDQELIRSVLNDKVLELQKWLKAEADSNSTDFQLKDALLIDSFTIPILNHDYNLNISIDTIQVSGISSFTISDIATNVKSRKVSVLLVLPDVHLSMYYKLNGQHLDPKDNETRFYVDKGKVTYSVHGWRTVLAGKVVDIVNKTIVEMAGFGMRSHYDFFETQLESFVYGQDKREMIDICKLISSEIMKKAINAVDDKFESVMLDRLNFREMTAWTGFKDSDDNFQKEEDGQLLMMESKITETKRSDHSRRRQKRQVPCEAGEELDEYVDSLFRFLKRLVRVMEPFNLPNATVELEEYNLQIFLHSGGASRAYTFERKKPAWVLCQNETNTISLGLTVGIEDLRIMYKYRVIQDWRLLFDGDLEAQVRRPKAQIQITQLTPPENEDSENDADAPDAEEQEEQQVQQRLDKLKVWKPGQIVVLIRGLGNFSSALSMIINQMLSDTSMLDPVIRMLENDGPPVINEMLKNVSIPIFSII